MVPRSELRKRSKRHHPQSRADVIRDRTSLGGELSFQFSRLVGVVRAGACRPGSTGRGLGAIQHRGDLGDLPTAGPQSIGGRTHIDAAQCVAVGSVHPATEGLRPQHRRIGEREPDGRGARVPVGRSDAFPDTGQVAVEPAAVRRDLVGRLPHAPARGGLVIRQRAGLGFETRDVVAAGQQGLKIAVRRGGDQACQCRLGLPVLAGQSPGVVIEPLLLGFRRLRGRTQLAASLHRRPCRTYRVGRSLHRGQENTST